SSPAIRPPDCPRSARLDSSSLHHRLSPIALHEFLANRQANVAERSLENSVTVISSRVEIAFVLFFAKSWVQLTTMRRGSCRSWNTAELRISCREPAQNFRAVTRVFPFPSSQFRCYPTSRREDRQVVRSSVWG